MNKLPNLIEKWKNKNSVTTKMLLPALTIDLHFPEASMEA